MRESKPRGAVDAISNAGTADAEEEQEVRSRAVCVWYWLRVCVSGGVMCFCIVFTHTAIVDGDTTMWPGVPGGVTIAVLWALVLWLAALEGTQVPLIALSRADPGEVERLTAGRPAAQRVLQLSGTPRKLERFLLGERFLKTFLIFLIAKLSTVEDHDHVPDAPLGLPDAFIEVGQTGFTATHFVCILGQLIMQMAATRCMVGWLSLPGPSQIAIYTAQGVESSGILHFCYFLKRIIVGQGPTHPATASGASSLYRAAFLVQSAVSLCLWLFACASLWYALASGWTNAPFGLEGAPALVVFAVAWLVLSFLDGLQVAATTCVNLAHDTGQLHGRALRTAELATRGSNLQSFFIGRQLICILLRFLLAGLLSVDSEARERGDLIFGIPAFVQETFLESGFLGALLIVVGPLTFRLIAASYPVKFIAAPGAALAGLYASFCVEATGVVHAAWPLTSLLCRALRLRPDPAPPAAGAGEEGGAASSAGGSRSRRTLPQRGGGAGGGGGRELAALLPDPDTAVGGGRADPAQYRSTAD